MAKSKSQDDKLVLLLDHYNKGVQDMDTRRTRKNGWNDVINAYMSKLPKNWPYTAVVTDPRIRTTILEKTARLLNSKLQGRLIPREGGDVVKARINNAILDFQWDNANEGGSMVEKIALSDQVSRVYGAAFTMVYWDTKKEANEIKVCDPRDIFIDPSATHIRNAKWVQYREYTTLDKLEDRGYDVGKIRKLLKNPNPSIYQNSDQRANNYVSQVLSNRGLEDRVGQDLSNPVVEHITEVTPDTVTCFVPRYGEIVHTGKNPYDHKMINFAQLRYYPLGDDIYGESEVESVIPLQRAINAVLCGFIDEMNLSMRPPLKLISGQYVKSSIEYGPGAQWILTEHGAAEEAVIGTGAIQNFNATYPALIAAFNTAMGDQSLGTSAVSGQFGKKTATEVASLERQQNSRDQYNQLYLSEFLKDIMMMWVSNNKQYLFDDPEKKYIIYKIIGKENVRAFQSMMLDERDIPDQAMMEIQQTIEANPEAVTPEMMTEVAMDSAIPTNPIVTNPEEENPELYDVKSKLDVKTNGEEADLYVTPDDMQGVYDYVPDVKSMSAGAGIMQQQAQDKFMERVLNPQVSMMLQTQGEVANIKEILIADAENAGYKDAERLFQPAQQQAGNVQGGQPGTIPGQMPLGTPGMQGMGIPQGLPLGAGTEQIPQPQGLPIQ